MKQTRCGPCRRRASQFRRRMPRRLQAALAQFDSRLVALRDQLREKPALWAQLPDVEIYAKAVRYALQYNEFFNPGEIPIADKLLARGNDLANLLARGEGLETGQKSETRTVRACMPMSRRSTVPSNPTGS